MEFKTGRGKPRDRLTQALAVFKGDKLLFGIGRRVVVLGRIEVVEVGVWVVEVGGIDVEDFPIRGISML